MKIYTTYFANVRNLPDEVVPIAIFSEISEGKDCALVCYEAPDKFCHRHLVAEWLNSAGYNVNEFGVDNEKA